MKPIIAILSLTLTLLTSTVMAQTEREQLTERLDNIDARIDQERSEAIISPFEADQMHNEVQQIRDQMRAETDYSVLNEDATAIEERLYPPH